MLPWLILATALAADTTIDPVFDPASAPWIMSATSANEVIRRVAPEVHEVVSNEDSVEIHSAGISLFNLGPFQNPLTGEGGVRDLRTRLPRKPVVDEHGTYKIGPGQIGVFLNGVPLYNRFAEASYLGRNAWHFDTVAIKDPSHPSSFGLIESFMADGKPHLLGFALDGYPIYAWSGARSGYRLRAVHERTIWPDGTQLTPSQYGPPVDDQFPLGTFAEDYEYRAETGDQDQSNGTATLPSGVPPGSYAYFFTSAFPYFPTGTFHGRLLSTPPATPLEHDALRSGVPTELRFSFPNPTLEIVHERPIHLMAISADLEVFDHIHPEWVAGGWYAVTHTFPKPGNYRLYVQYTPPGDAEHTDSFDITVANGTTLSPPGVDARNFEVSLHHPPNRIQTGRDVKFTLDLKGDPIEPYLGSWAHFALLDQGMTTFIHAHPGDAPSFVTDPRAPHIHGLSDAVTGPPPTTIEFTTNFSKPGLYKLWAQFQVNGQVEVRPLTFTVDPAPTTTPRQAKTVSNAIRVEMDQRGFTPARIESTGGGPVMLAIHRSTEPNCGSQIVFPSLGIKRDLPVGETTIVELPKLSGDLAFTCGMGMYRGMIVAVGH